MISKALLWLWQWWMKWVHSFSWFNRKLPVIFLLFINNSSSSNKRLATCNLCSSMIWRNCLKYRSISAMRNTFRNCLTAHSISGFISWRQWTRKIVLKMSLISRWPSITWKLLTVADWLKMEHYPTDIKLIFVRLIPSITQSSLIVKGSNQMSCSLLLLSLQLLTLWNIVVNYGLYLLAKANPEFLPQWLWLLSSSKMSLKCTLFTITNTWGIETS
jgi:hypothetical protein